MHQALPSILKTTGWQKGLGTTSDISSTYASCHIPFLLEKSLPPNLNLKLVQPRAASFEPVQKNFVSIYTSTLNEPHLTEQSRVTQSSPLCRICFNQYLAMHVYDSVSAMYMYIHVGTIQYYSMWVQVHCFIPRHPTCSNPTTLACGIDMYATRKYFHS